MNAPLKAAEHGCEEASLESREFYIPCNQPATTVVHWPGRQDRPVRMCAMCADHNVRNRGGEIQGPYIPTDLQRGAQQQAESPSRVAKLPPYVSADQICEKYMALRAHVKAETAAFSERMQPYNTAMRALENAADLMMQQTKQTALKTEHGTAFYSRTWSVTCDDHPAFLNWVFQYNARQFLTAHVSKDAVTNYMETVGEGHPPPGVKAVQIVNVNFRKA